MSQHVYPETEQLIKIITDLLDACNGSEDQFRTMHQELKKLQLGEEIDPNFQGTLSEMEAFIDGRSESNSLQQHVEINELNLKRWRSELQHLQEGAGAVTIDHEQRRGREI
ncbi:hypothetical protein [Alteribacillus sp. HJP-4]|uniref:hypothetical protein n=1 Tax=Alteribacillus sp. HJP-4 TaxID=2775394 RepID=UPI0035CD099E